MSLFIIGQGTIVPQAQANWCLQLWSQVICRVSLAAQRAHNMQRNKILTGPFILGQGTIVPQAGCCMHAAAISSYFKGLSEGSPESPQHAMKFFFDRPIPLGPEHHWATAGSCMQLWCQVICRVSLKAAQSAHNMLRNKILIGQFILDQGTILP